MRSAAIAALLALAACSGGGEETPDAGTSDAGAADAGSTIEPPASFPLVRLDELPGTTHDVNLQGFVKSHGPARNTPDSLADLSPARALTLADAGGTELTLFYTLPVPLAFAAFPNDQVRLHFREVAAGFGSSYAAIVTSLDGTLRVLAEDGPVGSALDETARLGFTFTLDTGQPLLRDEGDDGRRVHYPVVVRNGEHTKRLFFGQEEPFTLASGQVVDFHLVDAYRLEGALGGGAPELSIGYVVLPTR